MRDLIQRGVLPLTVVGLVAGITLALAGAHEAAALAWAIPSIVVAIRLAWSIVRGVKRGELGVDVIAILAHRRGAGPWGASRSGGRRRHVGDR
jgi:hypothetical protein